MALYITKQNDMLDAICQHTYGTHDGGVLEQVLVANPGLSFQSPLLPAGLQIELPAFAPATPSPVVRLWD
jgi:phage tail protein X